MTAKVANKLARRAVRLGLRPGALIPIMTVSQPILAAIYAASPRRVTPSATALSGAKLNRAKNLLAQWWHRYFGGAAPVLTNKAQNKRALIIGVARRMGGLY